jgi:hypothetical protein
MRCVVAVGLSTPKNVNKMPNKLWRVSVPKRKLNKCNAEFGMFDTTFGIVRLQNLDFEIGTRYYVIRFMIPVPYRLRGSK